MVESKLLTTHRCQERAPSPLDVRAGSGIHPVRAPSKIRFEHRAASQNRDVTEELLIARYAVPHVRERLAEAGRRTARAIAEGADG